MMTTGGLTLPTKTSTSGERRRHFHRRSDGVSRSSSSSGHWQQETRQSFLHIHETLRNVLLRWLKRPNPRDSFSWRDFSLQHRIHFIKTNTVKLVIPEDFIIFCLQFSSLKLKYKISSCVHGSSTVNMRRYVFRKTLNCWVLCSIKITHWISALLSSDRSMSISIWLILYGCAGQELSSEPPENEYWPDSNMWIEEIIRNHMERFSMYNQLSTRDLSTGNDSPMWND